jgi:hypothetical protein
VSSKIYMDIIRNSRKEFKEKENSSRLLPSVKSREWRGNTPLETEMDSSVAMHANGI